MANKERRFQDGHEVLEHYVRGYQIPEGDSSTVDNKTDMDVENRTHRIQVAEQINKVFRDAERSTAAKHSKKRLH